MDCVKVALGNRGMTVEAARQCTKDRTEWRALVKCNSISFTRSLKLGPVFFRTALPSSCGYQLEMGGMPSHDAVGVNCKKGATTETQGAGVKHMG